MRWNGRHSASQNRIHSSPVIKPARIAPSILAADFAHLGDDVSRVADHIDFLHVDVMDGHFVPNISLGMPVIESLRAVTDLKFDCHLMTLNPDAYLEDLKAAGADLATVHVEVFPDQPASPRLLGAWASNSVWPSTHRRHSKPLSRSSRSPT